VPRRKDSDLDATRAAAYVERLLVRARAELFQLTLELSKCARELLSACGVCRSLKLTAEFSVGEAERFCAPQLLGITVALRRGAPCPFFFSLIHPFLDAILCVDKPFACVSHLHLLVNLLITPYQ
jgi:hypothetical protein